MLEGKLKDNGAHLETLLLLLGRARCCCGGEGREGRV